MSGEFPPVRAARRMTVARFVTLDLHGLRGTARRERLVLIEFVLAAALGSAVAGWILLRASTPVAWAVGCWILGIGVNYIVLALTAIRLRRRSRITAELSGVDLRAELRRATAMQLWLFVPAAIVVFALRDSQQASAP